MKALLALLLAGKLGKIIETKSAGVTGNGTREHELEGPAAEYLGLVCFLTLMAFEAHTLV